MPKYVTTFPNSLEFQKASAVLAAAGAFYEVVSPSPGYDGVGVTALVVDQEGRSLLNATRSEPVVCSGWVEHRPATLAVPASPPPQFTTDIFGRCAVMVLAPCVADAVRIRLIAHVSGDLGPVLPYLNAVLPSGLYSPAGPTFTFMEGPRMISLYSHRITVAKAAEMVDGWRTLERIRGWVNEVWQQRDTLVPCHVTRSRPPAVEVYKRLPGTNCRACGEKTCMAFALRLWQGETAPARCTPVFQGEFRHLQPALLAVCEGLGIDFVG